MRNCVRVARQTLTLFVWVRILVPQPWISPGIFDVPGLDFTIEVWLSLVERYVRDVEAVCSNHITSTKKGWRNRCHPDFFQYSCGFSGFLGPIFQNRPTVDVQPPKRQKAAFLIKIGRRFFHFLDTGREMIFDCPFGLSWGLTGEGGAGVWPAAGTEETIKEPSFSSIETDIFPI